METYDPKSIEPKWQQVWEAERAFNVANPEPGEEPGGKFYMLEMLPYPSGTLHMGHVLNYTLGDVLTHYHRRSGSTVLRPMGWDSFGLPAENAAIREGGHPREIIERNIANLRSGMQRLGWAIDWDREVSAHDPDYYRWTQWLFLRFFEAGLAYRKEAPVNWCPNDQTVVANEYVIDGRCERCGTPVVARNMEQWFFRITAYADQLLEDLALIDWPERTKTIQRNWIGRSEGADVLFRDEALDADIAVFTTRPDTLFGATFFVLAPEHPLVERLANDEIRAYVEKAGARPVEERQTKEKDGIFTGHHVINPVNGEPIPVWIADYVLMDYGTGAIMAVPAHDERDREFAERYDLPIRPVIDDETNTLVDSGEFTGSGRGRGEGEDRRVAARARTGRAGPQLPAPRLVVLAPALLGLPDSDRLLREVRRRSGAGRGLAGAPARGRGLPAEGQAAAGLERGVDERAVPALRRRGPAGGRHDGHVRRLILVLPALLRPARRFGAVRRPARRLLDARRPVRGRNRPRHRPPALLALLRQGPERLRAPRLPGAVPAPVPPGVGPAGRRQDVEDEGQCGRAWTCSSTCTAPTRSGSTSSSSAPPTRTWTGPRKASRASRASCGGCGGSSTRRPRAEAGDEDGPLTRKAHETIARVSDDIGRRFVFNTPIAAVMELVNELGADPSAPGARFAAETAVSLIQPYAPHIAEELWSALGHERLWEQPWPVADESKLVRETFELVIQVNGRVRDRVEASVEESQEQLVERALASERVRAHLDGKQVRQTIVVPGKLVNIVV